MTDRQSKPKGQLVYALIDPKKNIQRVGLNLDEVTRFLDRNVASMPTDMWNSIFLQDKSSVRAKVYAQYGWEVVEGEFIPTTVSKKTPHNPFLVKKVIGVIAAQCGVTADLVRLDSSFRGPLLHVDSLDAIEIIMECEDQLNIAVELEGSLHDLTVGELIAYFETTFPLLKDLTK
jgi:acyl carrier protein